MGYINLDASHSLNPTLFKYLAGFKIYYSLYFSYLDRYSILSFRILKILEAISSKNWYWRWRGWPDNRRSWIWQWNSKQPHIKGESNPNIQSSWLLFSFRVDWVSIVKSPRVKYGRRNHLIGLLCGYWFGDFPRQPCLFNLIYEGIRMRLIAGNRLAPTGLAPTNISACVDNIVWWTLCLCLSWYYSVSCTKPVERSGGRLVSGSEDRSSLPWGVISSSDPTQPLSTGWRQGQFRRMIIYYIERYIDNVIESKDTQRWSDCILVFESYFQLRERNCLEC